MANGPLSDCVTVSLSPAEVDALQDAVAGEIARYLMHEDLWPEQYAKLDALTKVGHKIGVGVVTDEPPSTVMAIAVLTELYEWAVDACYQGSGNPMTEPCWHNFISTWEKADVLLPRVATYLGRPDPRQSP